MVGLMEKKITYVAKLNRLGQVRLSGCCWARPRPWILPEHREKWAFNPYGQEENQSDCMINHTCAISIKPSGVSCHNLELSM